MPRPHPVASADDRHETAMGFRIWRMQAHAGMEVAHTHPDIEVNFLLRGSLSYLHGGAMVTVDPGRLTVLWGGIPHQTLAPSVIKEGIWITLPLSWCLQWRLPHAFSDRLLQGEVIAAPPSPTDLILLERWLDDAASSNTDRQRVLQLEMEARFHRLALGTPPQPRNDTRPPGEAGGGQMARITRFIAQHYREPLSVDIIAADAGLHPKYLMRLFKKQSGASVWEYLTRLRVAHAQRLLVTTDMKVVDVALESGFASVAPFYGAFAAYSHGLRPLDYRRRHQTTQIGTTPEYGA